MPCRHQMHVPTVCLSQLCQHTPWSNTGMASKDAMPVLYSTGVMSQWLSTLSGHVAHSVKLPARRWVEPISCGSILSVLPLCGYELVCPSSNTQWH